MLIDDIEDKGSILIIKIPNTKTHIERTFIVSRGGEENLDYISFYRKYVRLRPPNSTTRRFFLRYKNGQCVNQVIGVNTFGTMPREIATFLKLPNATNYTGHCFRRSSATLLADAGADITTLKRLGGWRSATVAEGYLENSIQNKTKISQQILGSITQANTTENITQSTTASLATTTSSRNDPIVIQNCQNFTINYNIVNNSSV